MLESKLHRDEPFGYAMSLESGERRAKIYRHTRQTKMVAEEVRCMQQLNLVRSLCCNIASSLTLIFHASNGLERSRPSRGAGLEKR